VNIAEALSFTKRIWDYPFRRVGSTLDKGRFSLIFSLNRLMKPLLRAFSIKDLPSPGGLSASGGEGIKGRGRSQGE
jgi:hypothetical protein